MRKGIPRRSEADATGLYQSIFEQGDGILVPQDSAIKGKVSVDSKMRKEMSKKIIQEQRKAALTRRFNKDCKEKIEK